MAPTLHPLERVDVAGGTSAARLQRLDARAVSLIQRQRVGGEQLIQVPRVSRAHDHAGYTRLIEHPTNGNGADAGTVARGDDVQPREQPEPRPAAEPPR